MALGKSILVPKGTASFWIIGTMQRDAFCKTAYVQLKGFESREQSDLENVKCLEQYDYTVPKIIYDNYFGLASLKADGVCDLQQFYQFIKDYDSRFIDAVDLIY